MDNDERIMMRLQRQQQNLKELMVEMAQIKAAIGSVIRVLTETHDQKDVSEPSRFCRSSSTFNTNRQT